MKLIIKTIALALTLAGLSAQAQVIVLQDFSNVADYNLNYFYGSWELIGDTGGSFDSNAEFVQGAGFYSITGSSAYNDADSKLEFFYVPNVDIGTNTLLAVSAKILAGNAATSFLITLVDANSLTAFAAFDTSAFSTGSFTTVYQELIFDPGFDATLIDSMIITGGQPFPTDLFNVSFDEISATTSDVPEPSTYALLAGLGSLAVAALRRRKTKTVEAATQ